MFRSIFLSVVLLLCTVNFNQISVHGKKTPSELQASTKKPVVAVDVSNIKLEKLETEEDAKKLHEILDTLFETTHKPQDGEIETAHKIIRLGNGAEIPVTFLNAPTATKFDKPELDPVLSELIGADIKKSIEAKRAADEFMPLPIALTADTEDVLHMDVTTFKPAVLTTVAPKKTNAGLIDQSVVFEEAGSETKQTSRIQIKKGPNGEDYEYEYVYYYYDDDDETPVITKEVEAKTEKSKAGASRSKSQYASADRGSTSAPVAHNEIQSRGGKTNKTPANPAPVVEEVVEERLPQNPRFPPRSKGTAQNLENAADAGTSGKKFNVKRPSLELVDSQSFNTNDKIQQKSGRLGDASVESHPKVNAAESDRKTSVVDEDEEVVVKQKTRLSEDSAESGEGETTTTRMDKVALDLYAYLANENLNSDGSNEIEGTTFDSTTDETTEADFLTTVVETVAPTTATTTTEAPTTTTEAPTTTTTTEAPIVGKRGGSPLAAGRNRFSLRNKSSASTTTAETTAAPSETPSFGRKANRFSRPTLRSGGRTTAASVVEEEVVKTDVKPVQATTTGNKVGGGRSRNRFNLRGSTAAVAPAEKSSESDDTVATTASTRLVKPRAQFSIRPRGRQATSTAAPAPVESGESENASEVAKEESVAPVKPTRPAGGSRLNLANRPNRLLAKTSPLANLNRNAAAPEKSTDSASGERTAEKSAAPKQHHDDAGSEQNEASAEVSQQANLNRLKNRPKIQVHAKADKPKTTAVPRRVNPLLKRKLGVVSTTAEPLEEEEKSGDLEISEGIPADTPSESKEEDVTEHQEVSSEQPRGLGLLNRRIALRRLPGQKIQ